MSRKRKMVRVRGWRARQRSFMRYRRRHDRKVAASRKIPKLLRALAKEFDLLVMPKRRWRL